MEEKIEEGEIKGAIEPATMRQTEIILNQMKKSVCKILEPKYGTGFFCKLEINNCKIPVLITNYHVFDDAFIESGKRTKVQLGNDKNPKIIYLNKDKRIYSNTNEEYDIMIIKLDKKDEIDDIQFLEIDDSLLNHNSEYAYEDKSIYILHYPFGSEIRVSYGRGFTKEKHYNFDMIHKCKTNYGSSGSPIFELSSNKVIGIHKSYLPKRDKNDSVNLGTFLKYPLKEIKKRFQKLPKKIPNANGPLKPRYRRVKTPQLMEKNIIKNRIEKANIAQDVISFNKLSLNKLIDHQIINKPKDLKKNNDNIKNDKIIEPSNNNPNHVSNANDLNQNNNGWINKSKNIDTNKLNIENNLIFHNRQKYFNTFQENPIKKNEGIINQNINNNINQNKNIQNIQNINNKEQINNNNKVLVNNPKKNIQNIQNINNKEQINNNKVLVNNPKKNIENFQNINNKEQIKMNPNKKIPNNINYSIKEITYIQNKKGKINNNQNIMDKREEIENNIKNNFKNIQINNNQKEPIDIIQIKNSYMINNQIKNIPNINNKKEEINSNIMIHYKNQNFSNAIEDNQNHAFKINIYKNNQNINVANDKNNINNRHIQNNNNNNNIDNKINPNVNIKKENEGELIIQKEPLVQNIENKNIGFIPEKPTLYNNYTHKILGRNYINNNKSNINNNNNFSNSIKEIHDPSPVPRDSIKKRIFKNKINNKNIKINVSCGDPQKFFNNKESLEKHMEGPFFTPTPNKSKNRIKKLYSYSLKEFC